MKPEIKIFKNTDAISEEIAAIILSLITESNGENIHIALSGGSTPKGIFKYLTETYGNKLCNSQFHFWWGDDRCVAPEHDDSNYKWANDLWLKPIGIPTENIHRIHGENAPEKEAIRYALEIEQYVPFDNELPRFDLIVLGLGEDGHTASIFPHQMELLNAKELCAVATHPTSGQKRITITGKVLNNACNVVFLATGSSKAEVVFQILNYSNNAFPATHIHPNHGNLIWVLDEDAASGIKKIEN